MRVDVLLLLDTVVDASAFTPAAKTLNSAEADIVPETDQFTVVCSEYVALIVVLLPYSPRVSKYAVPIVKAYLSKET